VWVAVSVAVRLHPADGEELSGLLTSHVGASIIATSTQGRADQYSKPCPLTSERPCEHWKAR
jgi:hypothetical protein